MEWDTERKYDFEICYWRKCWNIKYMIFEVIKYKAHNNAISEPLTRLDIDYIINSLKSLNSDNWQDYGGSIWDWNGEDNYSEHIKHDIESLQTLRKLMDKYKLEVYFYDSH